MVENICAEEAGIIQALQAGKNLLEVVEKGNHISEMNYQIEVSAKDQTAVPLILIRILNK